VYLTGFCLFLSLVLTRTFYIIQDLMHVQDEYAKLKKAVSLLLIPFTPLMIIDARDQAADASRVNVASGDQAKEIERLKKDLGKHLSLVVGYILMISTHFQTR
jgi:B-cell receptor-associated protein 31